MGRLILDTSVLVAGERGALDPETVLPGGQDVSVPAVAIAEFMAGVHLQPDPGRRSAAKGFLDLVLAALPVIDYTASTAEHHSLLLAHTRTTGRRRGAHDLIIAATARATDRTIITTDGRARFDELPGVRARLITV